MALLENIRKADSMVTVQYARSNSTKLEGDLGSLTVKHNSHIISYVLFYYEAKQRHQVMHSSWDCNGVFQVHTEDGIVEFTSSSHGLKYHDASNPSSNVEQMLINTIR